MLRYASLRFALALPTLAGVLVLVALLLRLIPGDPVDVMLGEGARGSERAELRATLGLDEPAWRQLAGFARGAVHGDLGRSIVSGEPVARLILERYPATLELTAAALVVAVAIALPLGAGAALRPGSLADRASLALAAAETALPTFCLGPLLILVFAVELPWFPVAGRGGIASLVLPALTLGLGMAAVLARQLRSALLAALDLDCVRTARAKGLRPRRVFLVHALPNAATATLTVLGLQLGGLLAGAIVTETIFAWPGLGRLLMEAIGTRDYPLAQGCVLAIATTYVVVNLMTDLAQGVLDPRLREGA